MRKKITLIALAAAALLSGCDKSDTVQVDNGYTVQVEVSSEVDLDDVFVDVFVCLYEQSVANDFDFVKSVSSMESKREMTVKGANKDGLVSNKTVSPSYVSGSSDMGTHTIGDVKEGGYAIVVRWEIIFYDYGLPYVAGYAYKEIVVPGDAGVHKLELRPFSGFGFVEY